MKRRPRACVRIIHDGQSYRVDTKTNVRGIFQAWLPWGYAEVWYVAVAMSAEALDSFKGEVGP